MPLKLFPKVTENTRKHFSKSCAFYDTMNQELRGYSIVEFINDLDPRILSAVISALTSLIVAFIGGLYVLISTRNKLDKLRDEVLTEAIAKLSVENFQEDIRKYREQYSIFNKEALNISNNISELFSQMFRFYKDTARLTAIRHSSFLPDSITDLIGSTDDALDEIIHLKEGGASQAPEELADKAYRGMKSIIERLAEQ